MSSKLSKASVVPNHLLQLPTYILLQSKQPTLYPTVTTIPTEYTTIFSSTNGQISNLPYSKCLLEVAVVVEVEEAGDLNQYEEVRRTMVWSS